MNEQNSADETGPADREHRQDPIVERLRPDPARPALRTTTLRGFLGHSELPDRQRIYFTRTLDYYAEFRSEDVVQITALPAEESPFPGEPASMVELPPGVTINYVRALVTQEKAPFDLDIRPASLGIQDIPIFTDSVISPSCNIFDTTCTGVGCGDDQYYPVSYTDCPPPTFPVRRGRGDGRGI
jgi:hypothetical protein